MKAAKDIKPTAKFNTLGAAERFHQNMPTFSKYSIMLGDNDLFWIVTNREASILMKAGYELAD